MTTPTEGTSKRRIWLRIASALAAVVFLFLLYRAFSVYRFQSVPCEVPAALRQRRVVQLPDRLVVLTFNIEGHATLWEPDHLEEIAKAIRAQRADIIGLQEVHRGSWQSRFDDQAAELARLTGMNVSFGTSFESLGGEFGNAVLTRGAIRETNVVRLPGVGEPRTLLHTMVELDGRFIDFFVTHLASWGPVFRGSRTAQIDCIRTVVESVERPSIIVGDFNATPDAVEMRPLLMNSRFAEAGILEEPTHKILLTHIDYVIADRRLRRVVGGRVNVDPGDHWPVRIELQRTDMKK